MLNTVRAIVGQGKKIEFLEPVDISEGTEVLVTIIPTEEHRVWLKLSESCVNQIWDNDEDDTYEQLL